MRFEKLKVYQAAERLDAEVRAIITELGPGHSRDIDHLTRSTGSILFNIAEAHGAESPGTQRMRLGTARGESDEVRAVLRRLVAKDAVSEKRIRYACQLTSVIAKMLTSLIRASLSRPAHDP